MPDYFYDMDLVVDPLNPSNVVANGQVAIYDPADVTGTTLLALKDPTGLPLPNPLTSSANGFLPPRIAQVPQTLWKSGGFTGYFNSFKGLRDEAVAAVVAAQTAGETAAVAATTDLASRIAAGDFKGEAGLNGSNVLPTQQAIEQAIINEGPAKAALSAAVNNAVTPAVAAAVAADGTVVAAAASAVGANIAGRNLVEGTDARLAKDTPTDQGYLEAVTDNAGRVSRATKADGTQYIKKLDLADKNEQFPESFAAENVSWAPLVDKAGRLPEIYLDAAGKIPQSMVDKIQARMSGLPSVATPIDIILNMGQSNAQGHDSYPVAVAESDSRVLKWDAPGNQFITHPVQTLEYLGWAAARRYAQTALLPGRRVAVLNTAVGSTGFSSTSITPAPANYHTTSATWDRTLTADTNNRYLKTIEYATAALAVAPAGSRVVMALWSQGEEDVNYEFANPGWYKTKLDDMIAQLRTDLGIPALPFLIGSMTPEFETGTTTVPVAQALKDTPRRVINTAYIPGPANYPDQSGNIHWSAQGQAIRGTMFLDATTRAKLNVVAGKPLPPQNIRVGRSGNTARIKWDAPPARHTAFVIEYSTDTGSTWTAATLAQPMALEATLTVTASLPLWVRGKTTNEVGTSLLSEQVYA